MARGIIISLLILSALLLISVVLTIVIRLKYSKVKDTKKSLLDEIVDSMNLTLNDTFADLGAGDFRVVFAVARRYNIPSTGFEISPVHILMGRFRKLLRLRERIKTNIELGSIFNIDLSKFTALYINLDESVLTKVISRLENEADPPKRVFILSQELPDYSPLDTHKLSDGTILFEYEMPTQSDL